MAPPPLLRGPGPGELRARSGLPRLPFCLSPPPSPVSVQPQVYLSVLTPLPTPHFPFQMGPAALEPGLSLCLPVPAEATGTLQAGDTARHVTHGLPVLATGPSSLSFWDPCWDPGRKSSPRATLSTQSPGIKNTATFISMLGSTVLTKVSLQKWGLETQGLSPWKSVLFFPTSNK